MKKEELLKENGAFRIRLEEAQTKDERMRKEFAKAFGWYENPGSYGYDNKKNPRLPSWQEVFVETGRLLAKYDTLGDRQLILADPPVFGGRTDDYHPWRIRYCHQ